MRAAIAIACLALLTACGGSGDEPDAAPTSTAPTTSAAAVTEAPATSEAPAPEAELEAAVQAYSDAFLMGDGAAAYALLSARCQERNTEAEFTSIVDRAGEQYGDPLPFKSFDAEISGDLARATYTYAVAEINQDAEPWVREGGEWREDDC